MGNTEEGGETCWDLREKIMGQIKADTMQRNGKDLKVKIQGSLKKQKQQRYFWRAVDALRTMAKEEE